MCRCPGIIKLDRYDPVFRVLIGITYDDHAVYVYNLMMEWIMKEHGFAEDKAIKMFDYNYVRALPYTGNDETLGLYRFP